MSIPANHPINVSLDKKIEKEDEFILASRKARRANRRVEPVVIDNQIDLIVRERIVNNYNVDRQIDLTVARESEQHNLPIEVHNNNKINKNKNIYKNIDVKMLENKIVNVKPYWLNNDDFVFKTSVYRDVCLPTWFRKIQFKDLPKLVGSLSRFHRPRNPTSNDLDNFREIKRLTAYVQANLMQLDVYSDKEIDCIREYLVLGFVRINSDFTVHVEDLNKGTYNNFITHPIIKLPKFKLGSNSKLNLRIWSENDLVEYIPRYGNLGLTIKRLKGILKSSIESGRTDGEIISMIRAHCPVELETEGFGREFQWSISYIPEYIFLLHSDNDSKWHHIFKQYLIQLRNSILLYAQNWLTMQKLSLKERSDLRRARVERFKDHLRSPQIQRMYLEHVPHHTVCEYVNTFLMGDFTCDLVLKESFQSKRREEKGVRKTNIGKLRDQKYDDIILESASLMPQVDGLHLLLIILLIFGSYFIKMSSTFYGWSETIRSGKELLDDYLFRLKPRVTNIAQVADTITDFTQFCNHVKSALITCNETELDARYKVILIEFKTVIHAVYEAYYGNYVESVKWLSNFVVTRPEMLKKLSFLAAKGVSKVGKLFTDNKPIYVSFEFEDIHYKIPENLVWEFADEMSATRSQENKRKICEEFSKPIIELNSGLMGSEYFSEMFVHISDWASKIGLPSWDETDMRRLNTKLSVFRSLQKVGTDTASMIQNIISVLCRYLFSWDPFNETFSKFSAEMTLMVKCIDGLILKQDEFPVNKDLCERVMELHKKSLELVSDPIMLLVASYYQRLFTKRVADLERMAKVAKCYISGTKKRDEPVFVLFTGKPKVGKSQSTAFLQQSLAYMEGKKWHPSMTYIFNATNPFWEGYAQQDFMVMDDMFASVDQTMRIHEADTIIHAVNTTPFNLNMAFEGKGTNYFNSKFIFGSTNLCNNGIDACNFSDIGMTDPSAVKRRFHIVLHRDEKIDLSNKINMKDLKWTVSACEGFDQSIKGNTYTNSEIAVLLRTIYNLRKRNNCLDDNVDFGQIYNSIDLNKFNKDANPGYESNDVDSIATCRTYNEHLADLLYSWKESTENFNDFGIFSSIKNKYMASQITVDTILKYYNAHLVDKRSTDGVSKTYIEKIQFIQRKLIFNHNVTQNDIDEVKMIFKDKDLLKAIISGLKNGNEATFNKTTKYDVATCKTHIQHLAELLNNFKDVSKELNDFDVYSKIRNTFETHKNIVDTCMTYYNGHLLDINDSNIEKLTTLGNKILYIETNLINNANITSDNILRVKEMFNDDSLLDLITDNLKTIVPESKNFDISEQVGLFQRSLMKDWECVLRAQEFAGEWVTQTMIIHDNIFANIVQTFCPQDYQTQLLWIVGGTLLGFSALVPLMYVFYNTSNISTDSMSRNLGAASGLKGDQKFLRLFKETRDQEKNKLNPTETLHNVLHKKPIISFGGGFTSITYESKENSYMKSIHNVVSKGVCYLEAVAFEGTTAVDAECCEGFHLKDRLVIVPYHFFYKFIGKTATMRVKTVDVDQTFDFPTKYIKIDGVDVIIFKLPNNYRVPPSLIKYCVSEDAPPVTEKGLSMSMITLSTTGGVQIRDVVKTSPSDTVRYTCNNETFVLSSPICYYENTLAGDSGSLITIPDNQGQVIIVGIHIGARKSFFDKNMGIAIPFTRQFFERVIEESATYFETNSAKLDCDDFPLVVERTVPASEANWVLQNSRIKQSSMYGWNGSPVKIPVKMRTFVNEQGITINPLYKSLGKMKQQHHPRTVIPDDVIDYLLVKYPPQEYRAVLNFEEALNGVIEHGISSICHSTSAGYPYSKKASKGKAPYIINVDNMHYKYSDEFLKDIENGHEQLLVGQNVIALWGDALKAELRPIEKVNEGKTRLFSTCPLHLLIYFRMYFLSFITYVQRQCATNMVAVGINPHSIEWTILHNRFVPFPSIIAGDFSNWDGSVPRQVGEIFLEFVNRWYDDGEQNARVRGLLMDHIWAARHIVQDKIYQNSGGNPSGNPITSIYNSFCQCIMLYTIFTQDLRLRVDQFDFTVYGDDNIIGLTIPKMRCKDLAPLFLERFGMIYTHFSKFDVEPYDTMETIRYLGRKFSQQGGIFRAPLEYTTVVEATYWIKKGDPDSNVLKSTTETMMVELSHFDKATFDKTLDKYFACVKKTNDKLRITLEESRKPYQYYYDCMYVPDKKIVFTYQSRRWTINKNEAKFPLNITQNSMTDDVENTINQPDSTQQVELGSYQDVTQISASSANSTIMQRAYDSTNMEVFDLDQSIEREFVLDTLSWTTSQATGSSLGIYTFPQALFNIPYIGDKLTSFRFFKAGVRISVRINASNFLYGKLILSYDPMPLNNGRPPGNNVYELASYPHVIMSASVAETTIYDVPFVNDKRAISTYQYTPSEMGVFRLNIFNPLVNISGAVSTAQVVVSAQFIDASAFMPDDSFVVQSKQMESTKKAMHNSISSKYQEYKSIGSGIVNETIEKSSPDIYGFVKSAATIMSVLGLSKPCTTDLNTVCKINPFHDLSTGKGIDTSLPLAMDPENKISVEPIVGGIDCDEMSLAYIIGIPRLVGQYSFVQGTPTTCVMRLGPFDELYPANVDNLCPIFRYYSGSYKFKAYITASNMHSIRGVFFLSDMGAGANWMNCYHQVVDIKGDTEVDFLLPWTSANVALPYSNSAFELYFRTLAWSQPDQVVSNPMTINVYKSGASDFQFGGLQDCQIVLQSNPRMDFLQDFKPIHDSVKGFSTHGLIYGEKYESLRDIMHRYHAYIPLLNAPIEPLGGPDVDTNLNIKIGLEMYSLMYRFYRGTVRVKLIHKTNTARCLTLRDGENTYMGTAISSTVNPLLEVAMPYYHNNLFKTTRPSASGTYNVRQDSRENGYLFKSAGDDFSLHYFVGFPPCIITPITSTTRGYRGLINWMPS